ncbi:MAG: hypothetical protein EBU92_05840 [Betaproteobacteria bacterium]|nr:hypothetical protein [Betaproteobacteria bacterium]
MATLLYQEPYSREDQRIWAHKLKEVLEAKAWEKMDMSGFDYSWQGVAEDFINLGSLKADEPIVRAQKPAMRETEARM